MSTELAYREELPEQATEQPESAAATLTALKADFNALLARLKSARVMYDPSNPIATVYVDSVHGLDTNDGTRFYPLKTLAAAKARPLTASDVVGLARGSFWREKLDLSATDGASIVAVGSGAMPVLDASDVVTAWTLAGGYLKTYQASLNTEGAGADSIGVWEDGVRLTRRASVADVEANAGSFYAPAPGTNPVTVSIHPTGSGNPTSNGKTYEVSIRHVGGHVGNNSVMRGVRTRRQISNNGSANGEVNATLAGIVAEDGHKHNLFIDSGTAKRCVAIFNETGLTSLTMFIAFRGDARGYAARFEDCAARGRTGAGGAAFYAHTNNDPPYAYDLLEFIRSHARETTSGFSGVAPVVRVIDSSARCPSPLDFGTDDLLVERGVFECGNGTMSFGAIGAAATYRLRESCFYIPGPDSKPMLTLYGSGKTWLLEDCTWVVGAGNYQEVVGPYNSPAPTGCTVKAYRNIFHANNVLHIPTGVTYEGDYNVFVFRDGGPWWNYHGTVYSTLADWQAATGQDANSIVVTATPFTGSVADGDFRIDPNSTTAAKGAGPAEPPSAWPTVPSTIAEAEAWAAL